MWFQCELNACSFQLHLTQEALARLPATPATALLLATDSRCGSAESLADVTALAAAVREHGLSDKDSVNKTQRVCMCVATRAHVCARMCECSS